MSTNTPASKVSLVPLKELKAAMRKVLGVTKKQSDKCIEELHASNAKRRAAKKKP